MENVEAQKQIQQMRNFILNEARDKAQEIEARTLEDFNLEKLKLVQQMKSKIRADFQQKAKRMETERAIARSVMINTFRLKKIKARADVIAEMKEEIRHQLVSLSSKSDDYKQLCAKLIAQGLLCLLEDEAVIQCRKEDQAIVKEALPIAQTLYTNAIKKDCGVNKQVSLKLDSKTFLPSRITSKDTTESSCVDGVKIMTTNQKIVVDNTLSTRLTLVMEQQMPTIKKLLFQL